MSAQGKASLPGVGKGAPPGRRLFYGWWIVITGMVVQGLNSAVYYYGMAVFFTPLVQEFAWSRTALSGAFSIARLEAGIAGPLAGILIDRWGPRLMILAGHLLMGTGFILLSRIQTLEAFYLVFILFLSVGVGFGVMPPLSSAVANWFVRRRSLALGLLLCGAGVGGFMSGSLGWLITNLGWRTSLVLIGITVFAVGLPAAFIVRARPEPFGLLPDGDVQVPTQQAGSASITATAEVNFQPLEAIRTPTFLLLTLVFGARHVTTSGILVHLPTLIVDGGWQLEAAATITGMVALASIPGRLVAGWLGDRVDKRYVLAACLALIALGELVLSLGTSPWHLALFVLLYGPTYGGSVPVTMALVASSFGRQRYATIWGLVQFAMMWGPIGGPLIAGYVFDTTGSYLLALQIFVATALTGMLLALAVPRPRSPAP